MGYLQVAAALGKDTAANLGILVGALGNHQAMESDLGTRLVRA